jgi:thioredoxin 1
MNEIQSRSGKSVTKIIVPILIVVAVFGIWAFKNAQSNSEEPDTSEFALDATDNFNLDEILAYGLPVMIDFGADACDPCKAMAPILKELNLEYRGRAIVKFVDVWRNQGAADGFPLRVIPTQFFFDKDGNPYIYNEGGLDKESIVEIFKEMGVE